MFQTNEIGVTEHIEGDQCKFALWTGNMAPVSDYKIILRVSHIRQLETPIFVQLHIKIKVCIMYLKNLDSKPIFLMVM